MVNITEGFSFIVLIANDAVECPKFMRTSPYILIVIEIANGQF